MRINVTATLVPPPEFILEGLKPKSLQLDFEEHELAVKLVAFIEHMQKEALMDQGGSVIFMCQPHRSTLPRSHNG